MADFCRQCSIRLFGDDFGDLANLVPHQSRPYNVQVLCEGCGETVVDDEGNCLGGCLSHNEHKKESLN